jgi:hypothetical protein
MLKESDKDNNKDLFNLIFYVLNLYTLKSDIFSNILKNKSFNNYIINSLITLLLTLLFYNNYSFYIHSISLLFYITFIIFNIS